MVNAAVAILLEILESSPLWNALIEFLTMSLPALDPEAAQDFPDEKPKATSSDAENKGKKPAGWKRSHK